MSNSSSVKKSEEKVTRIKPEERANLRKLIDYSIDSLMDLQERLLIEHPVGDDAGFWTQFEVV